MTLTHEDHALSLVQDLLREYQRRGYKEPDRLAEVARWFGIKPSRVRHIKNNEAARIAADEYQRMVDGWDRYLDHKANNLEQELILIRARKAARG